MIVLSLMASAHQISKITSIFAQKKCHQMDSRWCSDTKSTKFVQCNSKGTRWLLNLPSKLRYIKTRVKFNQESEPPPGTEDGTNIEVLETCNEPSLCANNGSKGQGTLQGAMALIIGTSVGAGILALPARTMDVGFVPTLTSMGLSWCFLVLEALLLAEVNVAVSEQHKNEGSHVGLPLCAMAEKTLGPVGGALAACIYVFLTYTVLVAYIAKSGDVLSPIMHTSPTLCCWIFTLVFGSLTLLGNTKLVDSLNQILTSAMIGAFLLIIVGGFGVSDWNSLQHMNWERTPETFPVIIFALVYHDLMPVLFTYLNGDIHRIRQAVLLGSAVPVAMFLLWDVIILCIAPISGNEDPLVFLTRSGGTSIAVMIELFSILALATSFIGTIIGFIAFFEERLAQKKKASTQMQDVMASFTKLALKSIPLEFLKSYHSYKVGYLTVNSTEDSFLQQIFGVLDNSWRNNRTQIVLSILILAPPLVASSMVSDAFFSATDIAGGYGMTTLYGLFPPMMAWSLHERGLFMNKDEVGSMLALTRPQVQAILAVSGTCATGLMVSQLMLDLGM
ncbi:hypothetical protein GOP47_0023219 [Adiantum capillus-veneris]|uniref:Tyrosine-specific transport protein n=1 Tax=Adiantum capillus-veneris TaxID=13818 RepID=A0A9D4U5W8_ADICA|nr:hypothetical protein GOP47_0022718 [Adiantum capillus-veneris]KAI5062680.1 hypothetical protein GOP47_0023219 [Adiantum capillus-veneris]